MWDPSAFRGVENGQSLVVSDMNLCIKLGINCQADRSFAT